MKKELNDSIVRYDNTFNQTSLTLFTKVQTNVLFAILSYMSGQAPQNATEYKASFKFSEIRERVGDKNLHTSKIKSALDKLLDTQIAYYVDNEFIKANVFSHYKVNDNNEAEIALTSYMGEKLNLKSTEYTVLELNEYILLKNTYSKELYRLLRQFRHTGFFVINKNKLISFLNPPKKYNEYEFARKVLLPAIDEVKQHFDELSCNVTKPTRNLPDNIQFKFSKHKRITKSKQISQEEFNKLPSDEQELIIYLTDNTFE